MHGFVREELPLVCQKCNPAVTRRDPALRGKLLRQKCVSVGAPSCLASLSISFSLYFAHYIYLTLFFFHFIAPYTSFYHTERPFAPYSTLSFCPLLFTSSFFSALSFFPSFIVNSVHASLSINTFKDPLPHHQGFLPREGGFAKWRQISFFSAPTEKINTQSPAVDSLQYGLQSRTTGTRERENEGRK